MFGPLRTLGVPESLIDVVEPFFKVIVELGYDRSIPPWEPTPARLIPTLNPATVTTDLVDAIGEGINNAAALVGSPPLLSIPAPVTLAAPATETAKADISPQVTSTDTPTQTEQVTSTGTAVAKRARRQAARVDGHPAPADPASVTETVQADVSPQVTPTETVDETSHVTSTKKATETAKANEASERDRRRQVRPEAVGSAPPPPSRRSLPVGQRRLGPWCAVRSGWASSCAISRTAAMAAARPPGPPLPATRRRRPDPPRSHHRQPLRPRQAATPRAATHLAATPAVPD